MHNFMLVTVVVLTALNNGESIFMLACITLYLHTWNRFTLAISGNAEVPVWLMHTKNTKTWNVGTLVDRHLHMSIMESPGDRDHPFLHITPTLSHPLLFYKEWAIPQLERVSFVFLRHSSPSSSIKGLLSTFYLHPSTSYFLTSFLLHLFTPSPHTF